MKKATKFLSHLFGFEKLSKFERDYLHDGNIQNSIYMGFLTIVLEVWMLIRQVYSRIIPQYQEGGDLFKIIVTNTSRYLLLLLFGIGFTLFNIFRHRKKRITKVQFIALLTSGFVCILYTPVIGLESFIKETDTITSTMAGITNAMLIVAYATLFLFGVIIITYALFKYHKNKAIILLEHLVIILFTMICLVFGVLVSYTDFWGGKGITCFLMMSLYTGCLLIYRPYITFLILGAAFSAFYSILRTFQDGVSFKTKEIVISGVTHKMFSGDAINYIMFFISLATICTAIYHGRLKEARKTYNLKTAATELERKRKESHDLLMQTTMALASAIDAKDPYTNGHSVRVAEYSRKIAEVFGKSEEDCEKIYYTAILHDVGKIGIPNSILSKPSGLTDDEFEQIKHHTVTGSQILSKISEVPWLSVGAHYHHERYDGRGYPDGLKGEDIPEIARIIAVAAAYDAMTSNRSYREAIPQHIVREELVKGMGTQFDPEFAKTMIHLIDLDVEYKMKEKISGANMTATTGLHCESIYYGCTDGICITDKKTRLSFCSLPDKGYSEDESLPTLIIFDSLDGKVHPGEENNKDLLYFEYAKIRLDGNVTETGTRKTEIRYNNEIQKIIAPNSREQLYQIEAVRNRDHVLIHISTQATAFDVILAMPDTARYANISISGEHCEIHNITAETDSNPTAPDAIPRIAEEISYIKDCPVGDIPNIEVDGPRLSSTKGIPISDNMELSFHTMSYPTARLVWHCAYLCIFSSSNGQVDGENYREYMLLKLNGENWGSNANAENRVDVKQTESFKGWKSWMEKNKQGIDCTVKIKRNGNEITMQTENEGVTLTSVTSLLATEKNVYISITGDQCAITDIHVHNKE